MPAELDLHLLPFNRVKGQEWPQLPGLLATAPPRRAARGRESDWLIVYLSLAGNAPFTSSEYAQLVGQLAERFYQIPGALTSAMRSVVEILNEFLTDRNRKLSSISQQSSGRFIFGVLRGRQLTLAQSGPTHAFHLTPGGVQHFHDETLSGRGLGHGSATPIYFSQMTLQPGDQVLLCADLPAAWQAALEAERGLAGLEARRRKLLSLTDEDLNAVLVQTQAGKGRVEILQAMKPAVEIPAPPPAERESAPSAGGERVVAPVVPPAERPASRFSRLMAQPPAGSAEDSTAAPSAARPAVVPPRQIAPLPEIERPPSVRRRQVYGGLARFLQRVRLLNEQIGRAMRGFLPRLLPGLQQEGPPLSNAFLAFVAVVIPLALVVAASTVYVRYGKTSQYEENYQLAVQAAVGAIGQTDPAVVRHAWESCLYYLDRAEVYLVTQESRELRRIAQSALDGLDGIVRLDFRQVSGSLGEGRRITRMAATEDGLFMLDEASGEVLHALLTQQQELRINDFFHCRSGIYNGLQVGPLIDLAALPAINTRNADVLAMDGNGTLLYCTVGGEPVAVALAAPSVGWTGVRNFSLDSDGRNLYLLDQHAVWVYAGTLGEFTELPISFFSEQVPQNMNQVIDLAISGDNLYLLFQDGHMAACTLSRLSVVPTRCTDPLTFVDERPSHISGATITDAIFSQMLFGPIPDPSLYLLEPLTQSVYRFAPQADSMIMQNQFRASTDLVQTGFAGQQATAMAFGPNRDLFLCVGNKIYYASAVP